MSSWAQSRDTQGEQEKKMALINAVLVISLQMISINAFSPIPSEYSRTALYQSSYLPLRTSCCQRNKIYRGRGLLQLKMSDKEGASKQSNFFLQYLEDIVDYLDQKGGYVITEQQLKGGLGEKDLAKIKQAFDTPKKKPSSLSINLFIVSLTALPLIAWLKYALDNPCAVFHLC
jgi:hypothetical protein